MTAPAPTPMSVSELVLDDSWAYGAGVLHAGWLRGPATVEVEQLREGRTECEVWDSAGQLVAPARQLAGCEQP